MSECESDAAYQKAEYGGAFVCGVCYDPRRYFKTFGELEEHRHAEHTARGRMGMVAALCPIASPQDYACTLHVNHAGLCQDGCGNKWGASTAITEVCGYEFATGARCARGKDDCMGHLPPAPIVMPGLGSLSPEKRAEIDRLWTVVRGSGQQMLGAFPSSGPSANDGRALLSGALPVEPCACCGAQPPKCENLDARDVTGWALFSFPIEAATPTPLRAALLAREKKRLCPACGEKVAKFIHHLSTPMLHDEDLL